MTELMINWTETTAAVSELRPYERNPRRISKESYARLLLSLKEMGYHQRIICQPDMTVIGGHQRIRALKELGIKTVAVLIPDRELTKDEYKRLLVQDNLSFGEFDMDILSSDFEAEDLIAWGMPENLLGKIDINSGNTDEDEAPEPPANPISKIGDVWILGNHRLMCGDSTNADNVSKLLGGAKPNIMVTDPPYGVEYSADWRDKKRIGNKTERAIGKVLNDDRADWSEAWSLFEGNIAYIWHGTLHTIEAAESIISCGFQIRSQIIWAKNTPVIGRGDYHWQHEPCWYAVRNKGNWKGDRKQTTLWQINKPSKSETGHSTQKPIECMRKPIENNSSVGDHVYEPFSGSGTTIIACEQTGRKCLAMELNPAYVDAAVKRWEDFTGEKGLLETN